MGKPHHMVEVYETDLDIGGCSRVGKPLFIDELIQYLVTVLHLLNLLHMICGSQILPVSKVFRFYS